MASKNLKAHVVERSCGISNGYLKNQFRGKGGIGSEILEKIYYQYPDLDIVWLLTGEGEMLRLRVPENKGGSNMVKEDQAAFTDPQKEMILTLKQQIKVLKELNAEKEKVIRLLEVGGKR